MKGLTLNSLEKKTEAIELVRKGLRLDMKSHICWHVYGLLYRADRDYREAAKAYLHALKFDTDNHQILRDLALLQVQIRDYDGLEGTRRRLLTIRPNQRNNWIGFALAYHLLGNYSTAVSVLDTYQDTLKQSNEQEDRYEVSELMLYKNLILEESGRFEAALSHLDLNRHRLVDHLAVRETRARLLYSMGKHQLAADALWKLLSVNPDNHMYIRALLACSTHSEDQPNQNSHNNNTNLKKSNLQFSLRKLHKLQKRILGPLTSIHTSDQVGVALDICDRLTIQYPYSRSAQRIALDVIPADHVQFIPRIDAYVRKCLRCGVPSLFSDVKPLYENEEKANAFGLLFQRFRQSLEDPQVRALPQVAALQDNDELQAVHSRKSGDDQPEQPCTLLWVLHFLAQHYDRMGSREKALDTIEAAIEHTPTAVECYMVKARVLKHCGNLQAAVQVANECRNLDLADRYLNTKCAKYALRADMIGEAETWVGLFTRDGDSGGAQALYDMQCMWFELGAAEAHLRRNELPQALKKFTAVERHFGDMVEDQFDFHSYCLRKVTLRAYISLIRFEDEIRAHPYYLRAAAGVLKCLVILYDMPERQRILIAGEHSEIKGFADMTEAERKKAISKHKKQLARQRQQTQNSGGGKGSGTGGKGSSKGSGKGAGKAGGKPRPNGNVKKQGDKNEKGQNANSNDNRSKSTSGWMESDAQGIEYVKQLFKGDKQEDPILRDAKKIVMQLQEYLDDQMDTHVHCFEIAVRRKKYLQMLRAVNKAHALDPDSPEALLIAIKLAFELSKEGVKESFSEVVVKVFEAEGDVLGGKSVTEHISNYLERNAGNAEHRVGAVRATMWLVNAKVPAAGSIQESCTQLSKAIERSDGDGTGDNVLSFPFCRYLLLDLKREGLSEELLAQVAQACRAKHPRATFL